MTSPADDRARAVRGLVLVVPAFLFGFLTTAQWQTQEQRPVAASRYQITLAEAALEMQRTNERSTAELDALRHALDELRERASLQDASTQAIQRELEALRDLAGLTERSGQGLVITLDDARLPANAPMRSLELGIVHSTDITDVLNAAWKAGASAISVNGERITAASACVGAVIQINGTLLSPPFEISVVGPRDALYSSLSDPEQLRELKARRDSFGLRLVIERAERVTAPPYRGPLRVRHARPS